MNRITYGENANPLRLELDATPAASKITILGPDGSTIVAATAATLLTATTTTAAAAVGDDHIHCTAVVGMVAGDRLWLAAGASGPGEAVTVRYIDTLKVYLAHPLTYDHASGVAVSGLFLTYTLDATSATNYPKGKQITALWRDETTLHVWTQLYEVIYGMIEVGNLAEKFAARYPTTWEGARERWADIEEAAYEEFREDLELKGRILDRLRDSKKAEMRLLKKARIIALQDTGDTDELERKEARSDYAESLNILCNTATWWDEDQDLIQVDEEKQTSEPWFFRGF